MFRKEGYLNFSQIHELILSEWADDLDNFQISDSPDFPSATERKLTLVAWGVRTVIDSVTCAVLIDHNGRTTEVDAWQVFFEDTPTYTDTILSFPGAATRPLLDEARQRLSSGWTFLDEVGTLTLPWSWRNFTEPNSLRTRLRRLLLPFRWQTAAVKEVDALTILHNLRNTTAAASAAPSESLAYIFDCFCTAFPNGKGEATWKEVQQKVGYSRRSILRALEKYDGQSAGQ